MKNIIYGIKYIIGNQILKKHTPLIAGLAITNKCNLRCQHCRVTERETEDMSFKKIISILDSFYKEGGRTVYIEGGEPFIWHDKQHNLEDIVVYAHKKRFHTVVIYTNGTIPIETSADTVFISIDGLQGNSRSHTWENI